jgi:nucleoside-diphosphate-sugar epimerase
VDATLRASTAEGVGGQVINVGSGHGRTLREVIDSLNELFGCRMNPVLGPPRPGDIHASYSDISLAKRLLGYEPTVGFQEGLRQTVEWMRSRAA